MKIIDIDEFKARALAQPLEEHEHAHAETPADVPAIVNGWIQRNYFQHGEIPIGAADLTESFTYDERDHMIAMTVLLRRSSRRLTVSMPGISVLPIERGSRGLH